MLVSELGEGSRDPSPLVASDFSEPGVGGFFPGFLTLGAGDLWARAWLSGSSLVTVGSDGDKILASVSKPPTKEKHSQTVKFKLQGLTSQPQSDLKQGFACPGTTDGSQSSHVAIDRPVGAC